VRCELDATFETKDGGRAYITTKALNEFDPAISGVNWRQKLESQRAAVLANELKNNRNKLARCPPHRSIWHAGMGATHPCLSAEDRDEDGEE
jgi:hypothetical protein